MWDVIGNVASALIGSNASKSAANKQSRAAKKDREQALAMYEADVARNQPFLDAGTNALGNLMNRMGLAEGSTATMGQPLTAEQVMAEPGYQFGREQGQNALQQILNARGQRFSGPAAKALARYGTDYATGQYQNAWGRQMEGDRQAYNMLTGLIGTGQAAANRQGAAGQQLSANASNNIWGAANANAANSIAQGNIWGNAINQGISAYQRRSQSPWQTPTNPYMGPGYTGPIDDALGGGW